MRAPLLAVLVLAGSLAGCGEDRVVSPPRVQALSEADLDRFVDEMLLDEDLPGPPAADLSDDEIDEIVEDLLGNP